MIKSINNNVFIKRFPMENDFGGINISGKACVKNYKGIITSIESDKFVTIGDEVLIPHYGVVDVLIDGIEYAHTKAERLFAVKDADGYRPVNKYVKIRKCTNDHIRDKSGEIALYMTDNHLENTEWVEILEVAEDCETITNKYVGYFCVSPEDSELLARIGYTKDFCLHESAIKFVTNGE